jgi:hypothetical protein
VIEQEPDPMAICSLCDGVFARGDMAVQTECCENCVWCPECVAEVAADLAEEEGLQ